MKTSTQLRLYLAVTIAVLWCVPRNAAAQSNDSALAANRDGATANATSAVPPLVRFSGVSKSASGEALTGTIGVTFLIYAEQQGGAPLWLETQNVQPDSSGQYSVMLGATKSEGLPASLFVSVAARWLGVQISGQAEQPRVPLVSVPYAMKAADADTVGGLPASAFLLATLGNAAASGATAASQTAVPDIASVPTNVTPDAGAVTGSGTAGNLSLWTTTSNLASSGIFQASNGFIGIDTATPATGVDVANNMIVRGGFTMPPEGTATASTSFTSHSYYFQASAYNSAAKSAELQSFQWQAIPEGNNTATPSGVLNLRFAEGTAGSASTGFSIASNGILTFAAGQTFPGVPELGTVNTFTGSQTVNGTLTANATAGQSILGTNASNAIPSVEGINNGSGPGLAGFSASTGVEGIAPNVGVYGGSAGSSVQGSGRGKAGVWGDTGGAAGAGYYGVLGTADNNSAAGFYNNGGSTTLIVSNAGSGDALDATSNPPPGGFNPSIGVHGVAPNVGVAGTESTISGTGQLVGIQAGVWGDGNAGTANSGVVGSSDNGSAGAFYNNSDFTPTLEVVNGGTAGLGAAVLVATGTSGSCSLNSSGDLGCTGKVTTAASVAGGTRQVALYSVQSPENWFEDFGTGTLSNGAATVALDPTFAQTVNSGVAYHVFLTPNGDCKGLFVTQKSPTSFEVREIGGGTSSVAFDYRIVAKRAGFEDVRLADVTAQIKRQSTPARKVRPLAPSISAPKSTSSKPPAPAGAAPLSTSARPIPH